MACPHTRPRDPLRHRPAHAGLHRRAHPVRPWRPALLALLFLPLAAPLAAPQATGGLTIGEILPDPDGGREFIELWNDGPALDLAGWQIRDAANNTFTFPIWNLSAGGRVVVWGGGAADALGPAWSSAAVWNNGGDTARLLDPSGALVATLTYGDAALPAPPKGRSVALVDGSWRETSPTPGLAPDASGGTFTATVQDVAPRVSLLGAPSDIRTGASLTLTAQVEEDNGDAVTWTVRDAHGVLATGDGVGPRAIALTAPTTAMTWTIMLEAQDAAGNTGTDAVTVSVRDSDLLVVVPDSLAFAPFPPGASNVTLDPFTVENLGSAAVVPKIDVSPLRNGGHEIPVDGNLLVGTRANASSPLTWTPYAGPLTAMPELAPGQRAEVLLRIEAVPVPLAAGTYGTSFTVVP